MPSEKILEQKKAVVEGLAEKMGRAASGVLVKYQGITVEDDTKLRAAMRAAGVEYVVLKNTLVRRALAELNIEGLDEVLNGPSAFAFGMNDPVSPAKIINDFITKNKTEAISIKAGLLGSDIMTLDQIKSLAETPSREVLLARLLGSLQSSIAGFVRVLDAIAKKDTEAAPEA